MFWNKSTAPPQKNTRKVGAHYEDLALEYLKKQKLKLFKRNFNGLRGEIDLIMWDDKTLVFVEVRYRKSKQHGHPSETVQYHKKTRLIKTAELFLCKHFPRSFPACRFDIVAIYRDFQQNLQYDWMKNAFELR